MALSRVSERTCLHSIRWHWWFWYVPPNKGCQSASRWLWSRWCPNDPNNKNKRRKRNRRKRRRKQTESSSDDERAQRITAMMMIPLLMPWDRVHRRRRHLLLLLLRRRHRMSPWMLTAPIQRKQTLIPVDIESMLSLTVLEWMFIVSSCFAVMFLSVSTLQTVPLYLSFEVETRTKIDLRQMHWN